MEPGEMNDAPQRLCISEDAWEQELATGMRMGLTKKQAEARIWRLAQDSLKERGNVRRHQSTGTVANARARGEE
jgi:hypothetical protein